MKNELLSFFDNYFLTIVINALSLPKNIEEMMDNPFVTNGYAGPEYFCDRVEETALLTNLLTNGNDIALMSPRRVGKTDYF